MNQPTAFLDGQFSKVLPHYVDDRQLHLPANAMQVLSKRYLWKKDGNAETPAGMFYRVARWVGLGDIATGATERIAEITVERFYDLLASGKFLPNSPTFTGAGTPLGQLAACFVLPLEDDMGVHEDGIFSILRKAVLIQKTGGGNGFSFGRLRPKGSLVSTSGGVATGPVGFLGVFDKAFGEVAQGGSRRGANMAVLPVWHPDIEEFIACKANEGKIANFNISVAITDDFMDCVQHDLDFELLNPHYDPTSTAVPRVAKLVKARYLFDLIVKHAHQNGEPGVLFIDAANASNPVPHIAQYEATNPCVTGDTLIYTAFGLHRAEDLYDKQVLSQVTLDSRFGESARFSPASSVLFKTGRRPVYQVKTKEGYSLKATSDHQIMTPEGWVEVARLIPGSKVHILNQKGGFGEGGSLSEGRVMGWLMGDGTFNIGGNLEGGKAGLMFFGDEQALAPQFAGYVNELLIDHKHKNVGHPDRQYTVGVLAVEERAESRIVSSRLKHYLADRGFASKDAIPSVVFAGSEEMQMGFLQGLFSADGTVLDNVDKGVSVRLWSNNAAVLEGTQQLLLNFGVASKIFYNRKVAALKSMPNGQGGHKDYQTKDGHELVVSKDNLFRFQQEIGFLVPAKTDKLANAMASYGKRGPYSEYYVATVESVTPMGVETVYDLNEPLTHSFIANGIVVHNCGEQYLLPYENCCLGSINLAKHTQENSDGDVDVDWIALALTIADATHFLDNVVTVNSYVPAVPELKAAGQRARRIGLGIMGLGDLFYAMGIRYGSPAAQELAAQIMEFVRYHAMSKSITLAAARGSFPAYYGSIYEQGQWEVPRSIVDYSMNFGRPPLYWTELKIRLAENGIRNAAQTTIAPTGTLSTVSGVEGYGCEPVFALGYIRHFKDGDNDVELNYTSPLFAAALDKVSWLSDARKEEIRKHVATYGSCQDIHDLPESIRHTFVVTSDITAQEHVQMQAVLQAFVDNSISKTVNFPSTATTDDVATAYRLAWALSCKGITVYIEGSRQQVVLETKATQQAKAKEAGDGLRIQNKDAVNIRIQPDVVIEMPMKVDLAALTPKRKRPNALHGTTYRKATPLGKAYVTVNSDDEGEPLEVFVNVGKAGSETAAISEAFGRLISLVLRLHSDITPTARLRMIEGMLRGIGGGRALGFGPNKIASLPDGIARVIHDHLQRDTLATIIELETGAQADPHPAKSHLFAEICPECGEASFINTEGCKKCHNCGYSEC